MERKTAFIHGTESFQTECCTLSNREEFDWVSA